MSDIAHDQTDLILLELEKKIKKEFKQASKEVKKKLKKYLEDFIKKDKTWKEMLLKGEVTEQQYKNWRTGQIIVGRRWLNLRNELADIYVNANDVAKAMTAETLPAVYALNHDYITYTIEKAAAVDTGYKLIDKKVIETILFSEVEEKPLKIKVTKAEETGKVIEKQKKRKLVKSQVVTDVKRTMQKKEVAEIVKEMSDVKINKAFTLYDEPTVKRLITENPQMLPPPGKKTTKAIAEGKAKLWDEKQIQSAATQSIIQGESIPEIAQRLAETVGDKDAAAAVRNARTMITGAENAGRQAAAERATEKGINITKVWVATLDMRTRHAHRLLDGQRQPVDKPFVVDGNEIMYPGDMSAKPYLLYNCRCTYITQFKGLEKDIQNYDIRKDPSVNNMSYDEWKQSRKVWSREKQMKYNAERAKNGDQD